MVAPRYIAQRVGDEYVLVRVDPMARAGRMLAGATGLSTAGGGLLYPRQNQHRSVMDLSGFWQFQLDPKDEGEAARWWEGLKAPRTIAVPCSWNELFDDARDYLGLAWYRTESWIPQAWRGQRVFLRVGSANYASKVWVNGFLVAEHLGGHLPFVADITERVAWNQATAITISVENKPVPDRVPAGPSPSGGLFAGLTGGYPATTYDFFPYAGLQRPVLLFCVPTTHIDDVTDSGKGEVAELLRPFYLDYLRRHDVQAPS